MEEPHIAPRTWNDVVTDGFCGGGNVLVCLRDWAGYDTCVEGEAAVAGDARRMFGGTGGAVTGWACVCVCGRGGGVVVVVCVGVV